jgi:CheY-like chemotaxis protein
MIGTAQASLIPSFQLITRWRGDAATRKAGRVHPSAGKTIKKVAIVEDELMVAWTIESMLEDLGYEIVGIFAKGEDAIAALQDVAVDLVCMDINLGRGIDGIEAARRIRERQAPAILFITAYSDSGTKTRILESAPDAIVIGKPMTQAKLEQAIGSFTGSPSQ